MKAFSRYVSDVRLGPASLTNDRSTRRLVSNVVLKTTADVVSKSVTLIVTVVAARVLSPSEFGVLALAMTTGWLLSVASDAGLPLFLAKQAAQPALGRPMSVTSVLRVVRLRSWFGALALACGMIVGFFAAPRGTAVAFILIVLAQLTTAVVDTLSHGYRGIDRSDIESKLTLAVRLATGVTAVWLLLASPSLLGLAIVMAALPLAGLLLSIGIATRVFRSNTNDAVDLSSRRLVREIGPLGAGILISALYFRCDVYFIEWWFGIDVVGIYNAAFRIVEALRLFPAAVLAVAFPFLCRAGDGRPVRQLGALLFASGTLVMAVLLTTSAKVLDVLYGTRFVEAAPALRILALALPLFFANYALTHQVIAWQGQHSYLAITVVALGSNLVGNLALIPSYGMTGAAASTLLTEIVVAAGCLIALVRMSRHQLPRVSPAVDLTGHSVRAQ